MRLVKCWICGAELPEEEARPIFTGRRKYVCPDCYKDGHRQAMDRDFISGKVKRWEKKDK